MSVRLLYYLEKCRYFIYLQHYTKASNLVQDSCKGKLQLLLVFEYLTFPYSRLNTTSPYTKASNSSVRKATYTLTVFKNLKHYFEINLLPLCSSYTGQRTENRMYIISACLLLKFDSLLKLKLFKKHLN